MKLSPAEAVVDGVSRLLQAQREGPDLVVEDVELGVEDQRRRKAAEIRGEDRRSVREQGLLRTRQVVVSVPPQAGGGEPASLAEPAKGLRLRAGEVDPRRDEDLPHEHVLGVADPYLGRNLSVASDWTPLKHYENHFEGYAKPRLDRRDPWQFKNFLVQE